MMTTSIRLMWLIAGIAVLAVATAAMLGVLYIKESHDVDCQKQAAARDRVALFQLEQSQRDHLLKPSQHTAVDVVHDINHYLFTAREDDKARAAC